MFHGRRAIKAQPVKEIAIRVLNERRGRSTLAAGDDRLTRTDKETAMAQEYDAQMAKAWDDFCEQLKGAKDLVFRKTAPTSESVRADGFRYIAQYIGKAMDEVWNFREPMHPQLFRLMTPTAKSF